MTDSTAAFRGEILHFIDDPAEVGIEHSHEYFADGLLVVQNGKVKAVGDYQALKSELEQDVEITHYQQGLICPGFIDTHIHYPQTEMIASYGEQLLQWLENYTFPTEKQFADEEYAGQIAEFFTKQLLDSGTTTALVFGTVHKESVDAFFKVADSKNLRMICGKVLMDRNCPDDLQDTAETGYQDSKTLIEKWHGHNRLHYAVTPRFAPTSSKEQLDKAGLLLQQYPDVYMHTHISENLDEVAWVESLFPECNGYLDSYDQSGLLGERSVLAHGIHLKDNECQRIAESGCAVAHCPTSNLFLGSGLFNLPKMEQYKIKVGMGTDIGAGTSFSMLQTMNEAYKIQQLQGNKLTPFKSFYLATLGGARALKLEDKIGSFAPGNEADFVVLDYNATELMALRMSKCQSLDEKLFVLSMLGDDRTVGATYILGKKINTNTNE